MVTTGQVSQVDNAFMRTMADLFVVGNQLALLPLATITSLSEIAVPLVRGAGKTLTQKGKAGTKGEIGEGGIRTIWKTAGDYRKMWWNDIFKKDIADGRPASLKELNRFGRAWDRASDDRSLAMFGQGYGRRGTEAQNKFFKLNLLHDWTRFVQLVSYNVGKSKIYENLYELVTVKNMSKARKLRLSNQLRELNIDVAAGKKWVKAGGKPSGKFYNENFLRGASRYVDEVIMNPTAAANQKPIWHSMHSTRWAFGLMGFPTAFSNTVLKNAIREINLDIRSQGLKFYNYEAIPSMTAGATTMLAIGMFGNTIRTGGRNLEEIEKGEETIGGEVLDAAIRAGLLGPTEQAYRTYRARAYDNFARRLAMRFTGPAVDDIFRFFEDWVGPISFVIDEIPGIAALRTMDPEGYKAVMTEARKLDKSMGWAAQGKEKKEKEKKGPRPLFYEGGQIFIKNPRYKNFKGGAVSEDYPVPNVIKDPSERINPYTGQPYDAEMERLGLAEGGEANNENIAAAYFNDNPDDLEELRNLVGYTPPPQEKEEEAKPIEWADVKTFMKEQFGEGAVKRAAQQLPYLLAAAPEDLGRLAALPYDIASQHMPLPNIGAKERLESPYAFERYTEWGAKKGYIDKPQHTLGEIFYSFLVDPTIAGPMAAASLTKATPLLMGMTKGMKIKKGTKPPYRAELNELGLYSRAEQHLLDAPNDLKGQGLVDYLYSQKRKPQVKKEERQFLELEDKINADTTKEELLQIIREDRPDLYKTRYKADPLENIKATEEIQAIDAHYGVDHRLDKVDAIYDELMKTIKVSKGDKKISRHDALTNAQKNRRAIGRDINIINLKKKHEWKWDDDGLFVYKTGPTHNRKWNAVPKIGDRMATTRTKLNYYEDLFYKTIKNQSGDEKMKLVEDLSKIAFERNPYKIIKYEEAPEVYLYGNDIDGYQLMDKNKETPWVETFESGIGDTEAKIKLKQYLSQEYNIGGDVPAAARYEEYMLEGGRNYEEITINLRNPQEHMLEGKEVAVHFPYQQYDEPVLLSILTKERDVINKKTGVIKGETKHVDELQTDIHEAGKAKGYLTKEKIKETERLEKDNSNILDKLIEDGKIKTHTGVEVELLRGEEGMRQKEFLNKIGRTSHKYISMTIEKDLIKIKQQNPRKYKSLLEDIYYDLGFSIKGFQAHPQQTQLLSQRGSPSKGAYSKSEEPITGISNSLVENLGLKTIKDFEAILPEAIEFFNNARTAKSIRKSNIQDLPFKDIEEWAAKGIQAAIQEAAEGGQKYVSFSSADIIGKRYEDHNPKFYKLLYDKVIPRVGNKISKKLGAKTSIEDVVVRSESSTSFPSVEGQSSITKITNRGNTERMFTIELTPEALAKGEKEGWGPVFGFSKGGLVNILQRRQSKRDGGSADIEEIEVLARKRGQYILDEDIVEGPFTSYYNKPVRLKKTVMKDLIKAQEEIPNIPINIVDNTVRKDVKVKARKDWIARGRKGPPQAGAESYHITGQAFDLNQEDPKMNNPEVWEVLRKNNFKQHPKEWWHYIQGEFIN